MPTPRVTQLLDDLRSHNPAQCALVSAVRAQVLALDAAMSEEVKYGGLLFGTGTHFCGIFAYTQHISLEFGEGASLPDLHRVLEGKGKHRRHIKLSSAPELDHKHVHDYLVLAFQAACTD